MEEPSLPPPAPLPPPDSPESRYGWAHPWIVADAAAWLEDFIRPNHRVFEWGSGGSTTWFAARAAEIITVEHDHAWASVLRSLGLPNVTVLERPDDYPAFSQYAGAIIGEGMFDIILIDGADGYDLGMVGSRFACAALASQHIAAGGVIVLDNAGGASNVPAATLIESYMVERIAFVGPVLEPPGHHRNDVTETSIFRMRKP